MMSQRIHPITVARPAVMPTTELQLISSMCPRRGIFGYFIPQHREALARMKRIFLGNFACQEFDLNLRIGMATLFHDYRSKKSSRAI